MILYEMVWYGGKYASSSVQRGGLSVFMYCLGRWKRATLDQRSEEKEDSLRY